MGSLDLTVTEEQAGERLDVVVGSHPDVGSRAAAQRLIEAGLVSAGGRARTKRHRVSAAEHVRVDLPVVEPAAGRAPGPDVPHAIVHEDEHLIVVEKPAEVVVHPGAGHTGATLADALADRARGGEPGRAGIVHRLDRDTSGLLVVAKTEPVHAALTALLRERGLERDYLALVEGHPDAVTGTVEAAVGRDPGRRTSMTVGGERPRDARTHFRRLERLGRTSLLELRLDTGRTHQIRVHMEAIGHPVCGDRRYGGAECGRRLGLDRQFLHSARLAFVHPVTGEYVDVRSGLPADLQAALGTARAEAGEAAG